jgi:Bacteriophage tail sheath protein
MAFNAVNKVPDVYIDEIQLPGPIAGVGTSTAAFIGPAVGGEPRKPTLVTSWTQFLNKFGPDVSLLDPVDPLRTDPNRAYIPSPPIFVTHAVRGFFNNGGAACYFVRTSTAVQSSLPIPDNTGNANSTALVITAKKEGSAGDKIKILVKKASIVTGVNPETPSGGIKSAKNSAAELDAAVAFLPGDSVFIEEGQNKEVAKVATVSGVNLTFERPLSNTYTDAATIRTADFGPQQDSIRLANVSGIEPGTYLKISQGGQTPVDETVIVKAVSPTTKRVVFSPALTKTFKVGTADAIKVDSQEFNLTITPETGAAQSFTNLSIDPRHTRYFKTIIESALPAASVSVNKGNTTAVPPDNLPKEVDPAAPLTGGKDDNLSALTSSDYINALATLEAFDDVNMICIPDMAGTQSVQDAMITHCTNMQDRFAILDPALGVGPSNGILTQRNALGSARGFAAIYYPRIYINNPFGGDPLLVPPSGHIAGVYARTDESKGVHKAPANEQIFGALNLETTLTLAEMGRLNEQSVNVLRSIPGGGIRVWGARTISTNTQWRYVNVRRLLLFLEESIQEGTQFAVFEPNNTSLRAQVKRQVTDFLTRIWRSGALFGATPEEAFRVRVDEELNPPDVRALGQLIIEVVVVPTTPAEFIIFRIISDPTGNVLQEQ